MKIGLLLQARTGSTRLPGKIFMDLNGKYSIQRILNGCKKTIYPHKILLCMPKEDKNEITFRNNIGELDQYTDDRFDLFIGDGDSNDLIDRFYKAARKHSIDIIVRLTADNPMLEGANEIIDDMLERYIKLSKNDYFMGNNESVSNMPFPHGLDVEIFSYDMLCWAKRYIDNAYDREHCATSFYRDHRLFNIIPFSNYYRISTKIPKFTMDTPEDYKLLLELTANYDKYQDINKAVEETYEDINKE